MTEQDNKGYTGKQMCEHIVKADFLEHNDGSKVTADEIWNVSPTGELWQVAEWFRMACKLIGEPITH